MPRDKRLAAAALALALAGASAHADTVSACADGPAPIPDDATTLAIPLVVGDAGTVTSVTLDLDITHPWVGDLVVSLTDGTTTVRILNRTALGTYPFGCGGDDVSATFADDATATADDLCSPTSVPDIAGLVLPVDALSAFAGTPADSPWQLLVSDQGAFDSGTLSAACLTVTFTPPPPQCTTDLDGDHDTDVFDFAVFATNFGQAVPPGTGGDYDANGSVDVFDFATLAAQFGCTE